jgi:hypothetical protein
MHPALDRSMMLTVALCASVLYCASKIPLDGFMQSALCLMYLVVVRTGDSEACEVFDT